MGRNAGRKPANGDDRARRMLAQEAARIIVDQGIRDYRVAKVKAAERLGMNRRGSLPGNAEIERAIEQHHLLFGGDGHAKMLRGLRESALDAMEFLSLFSPRLVGPVLNGTADANSCINLHVFVDDVEAIASRLSAQKIAWRPYERRLKTRRNVTGTFAGYEFSFAGATVQATVFPVDGIRQAPLSPIDGKPMERADLPRVQRLVAPVVEG